MSNTPTPAAPAHHPEFRQGWRVLIAAVLGVACGASPLPFNSIGFFLGPINEEFGWSFRDISLGITVYGVLGALLAPVYGSLADRYGVRPVAILSLLAFAILFGALGFVPGVLWAWWTGWFLIGLVGIGSTPVTWTRGINLWFYRRRGLALGLTLVGTSLAAVIVPEIAVWGIENLGWRYTYPLIAMLPLLVALPVALKFFHEPRPDQRPPEISAGGGLAGVTAKVALRDYRFWLIFASVLIVAMSYGGLFVHLPQMLKMHGFDTGSTIKHIVQIMGLSILVGRIGTGWLLDRFWAPLVTLPLLSIPAISCWLLAGDSMPLFAAYISAAMIGLAAGAETDLVAYLAGRYFGMVNYGRIYGLLYMPFGFGSAVSPALFGWVRDATGNYDLALFAAMGGFVGGGLILLALGRYPDFTVRS